MPIRWNSTTDQTLLLKILETSSVNVDVKAVSGAWPKDQEAPTPRAISERLVKIRAMAKSSGTAAHFSVADGRGSNSSTPRRRRSAAKKSGSGVKKSGGAKRKRAAKDVNSSDSDDTDAELVTSPSQKTKRGATAAKAVTFSDPIVIKAETNGEDAMIASNDSTPDVEVNGMTAEI